MTQLSSVLACAALVVGAGGCRRSGADDADAGGANVALDAGKADQLAANELVEGKEKAYGLTLPVLMKVQMHIDRVATARGVVPEKLVLAYVQKRVGGGSLSTTPRDATFTDVRALAEPDRPLNIHVYSDSTGAATLIDVQDMTPLNIEPIAPEEAWRRDGITPNNKIIDPLQLK